MQHTIYLLKNGLVVQLDWHCCITVGDMLKYAKITIFWERILDKTFIGPLIQSQNQKCT